MFGSADLIGVAVIKARLDNLRRNPHHLAFILSKFNAPEIRDMVGPKHIKNCIDLIVNNKILVVPYNQLNLQQIPNIVVGATYSEEQQYLGDYGAFGTGDVVNPIVYSKFGVREIKGSSLYVDSGYKTSDTAWCGLYVVNGNFFAQVDVIIPQDGYDEIVLDKPIPAGIPFTEWTLQTLPAAKLISYNASTDKVDLQIKLETSGDIGVHNLYATVLRYCLKSGRMHFESFGLQKTIIGQGLPIITDETKVIVSSVFTVTGSMTDLWIENESNPIQQSYGIGIEVARDIDP